MKNELETELQQISNDIDKIQSDILNLLRLNEISPSKIIDMTEEIANLAQSFGWKSGINAAMETLDKG